MFGTRVPLLMTTFLAVCSFEMKSSTFHRLIRRIVGLGHAHWHIIHQLAVVSADLDKYMKGWGWGGAVSYV